MTAAPEHASIAGKALEAIAGYVADLRIRPGERLPTERELAERLNVARGTVREALNRWQVLGIIEKRQGSGNYLRMPLDANVSHVTLTLNMEREALKRTHELRRALDTEAAYLAAQRATEGDLIRLGEKLERLEEAQRAHGRAPEEDWEFHRAIYQCTHNPLFEEILGHVWGSFRRFFEGPLGIEGFSRRSFEFHRELYEAIAAHDAVLARRKTEQILAITEEDLRRSRHAEPR